MYSVVYTVQQHIHTENYFVFKVLFAHYSDLLTYAQLHELLQGCRLQQPQHEGQPVLLQSYKFLQQLELRTAESMG